MILRAMDITKSFRQGETVIPVLQGTTLEIAEGETIAILGKSGSGKSTLLSLLAGLDHPTQGYIEVAGDRIAGPGAPDENRLARLRARHIGIVFQQFHLLPHLNAWENVALPLDLIGTDTRPSAQAGQPRDRVGDLNLSSETRAKIALTQVGLGDRVAHFPHQLSGGEKQRVAIARALITQPAVLLADEPSGSLDPDTGRAVMGLLFERVAALHSTLILVTHDDELSRRCGRRLRLQGGQLLAAE